MYTVTFTCILVQGGGPPPDMFQRYTRDPGFRCQIIPELVWPYSRTRLLKFRSRLAYSWIHLAFFIEKVANMVPTWLPKWNQHGQKIDPKIDYFLMLLKLIFGWIMLDYVPKLRHVGNKMVSKIAFNIERPCFKKPCFFLWKTLFFEIQWVDVGNIHRPKNTPQMESKMECIFALIC